MAKRKTANGKPALQYALLRQLHIYVSVFVAPSLLFFAGTGALQTFRIPDQKTAPVVLQKLARAHKDDVFDVKPMRPKPPGAASKPEKPAEKPPAKPKTAATEAVKWFFAITSIGMILSTSLGLWMALTYSRQRIVSWLLLVAGAAIPIVLLSL